MLPNFFRGTVARIRPGICTSRGSDIPDWDDAEELAIPGCSIQPSSTSLSQDGRVLGIEDSYTAYLPPGTDVQAGDRLVFNGNTYTIMGEPRAWESPTGALSHIQLTLERWSG